MSQFNYNGPNSVPGQHQPLTRLSDLPTHPYQHDSPGPSQVLPPLHPQPSGSSLLPPFYKSNHVNTSPSRPGEHLGSSTQSNSTSYVSSQSPLPPSSMPQSYPASDSAHNYATQSNPVNMQPSGSQSTMMLPHLPSSGAPTAQNNFTSYGGPAQDLRNQDYRPLPVVGLQGRRGILPSAPGRNPIGSVLNGSARHTTSPMKNSDGKFPCPYCNKTYLHLKHLKRHQLRHTGERPYQCCLCSETFCRSDILKRHFTKCANRRGNPAGVGHLTHAQAHLKPPSTKSSPISTSQNSQSATTTPSLPQNHRNQVSGSEHLHTPASFAQESGRSSSRGSSVVRPESSSSNDDRGVTHGNTLPPMNVPLDPYQPGNVANGRLPNNDRPYQAYAYSREQMVQSSYPESHAGFYPTSSNAPFPSIAQPDHSSNPVYFRNGLANYADGSSAHVQSSDWSNYFQPGGNDAVMFSSH